MPAPLSVLAAPLGPNIVLCNLTLKFTSNIYFRKITWNLLNKFIKKIENFVQLNNILFYLTIVLLNHSQNEHYYEWILVQLIISPIDTTPISLICTCCGIGAVWRRRRTSGSLAPDRALAVFLAAVILMYVSCFLLYTSGNSKFDFTIPSYLKLMSFFIARVSSWVTETDDLFAFFPKKKIYIILLPRGIEEMLLQAHTLHTLLVLFCLGS